MEIATQDLVGQNITIVYKSLDLQTIDSRAIKKLLSEKAAIVDLPEMMVVMDPTVPVVIQLGDQRIRVTLQGGRKDLAPLWEIAIGCHDLISAPELLAFGFNYDIKLRTQEENLEAKLLDMVVCDRQMISKRLEGDLISISPRIRYRRNRVQYELVLEAIDKVNLDVHLNAHYQFDGIQISLEELKERFVEDFEYLTSMLPRLLV